MGERTILIVEDDADINALLAKIVAREGFGCVQAYSGTEALLQMERAAFDLVLLDMMLPGMDGPTLMACMRDELASRVPVIVVSAKAGSADKVGMLAAGADDYVTKPFDPDELLSRVRAILRRSEAYQPTVLAYGDLTLDPGSGNLSCGSESIRLSGREFQIMELFMRSPRQVFSAERIMERVWGWDNEAEINVVWVNISNLRKKLKSIGSHVTLQANRGLGYVLEESV